MEHAIGNATSKREIRTVFAIVARHSDGQITRKKLQKQLRPTQFWYELLVGKISKGLQLDHLCRNPGCVNPSHLEAVSPRENYLRGISPAAQNARKTYCIHGHPLYGENLFLGKPSGKRLGRRYCKTCASLRINKTYKDGYQAGEKAALARVVAAIDGLNIDMTGQNIAAIVVNDNEYEVVGWNAAIKACRAELLRAISN